MEKTSTPIKIKTIKKHSKIPLDIKKQQQQQRPKVDNIEWNLLNKNDDEKHVREISTVNMEDITEPVNQQFQHVTEYNSDNEPIDELTENRQNSESDDSLLDLPNKNIKINVKTTLGSSSESDIALHEPGAELSDDETGTFEKLFMRKKKQ